MGFTINVDLSDFEKSTVFGVFYHKNENNGIFLIDIQITVIRNLEGNELKINSLFIAQARRQRRARGGGNVCPLQKIVSFVVPYSIMITFICAPPPPAAVWAPSRSQSAPP